MMLTHRNDVNPNETPNGKKTNQATDMLLKPTKAGTSQIHAPMRKFICAKSKPAQVVAAHGPTAMGFDQGWQNLLPFLHGFLHVALFDLVHWETDNRQQVG